MEIMAEKPSSLNQNSLLIASYNAIVISGLNPLALYTYEGRTWSFIWFPCLQSKLYSRVCVSSL